MIVFFLLFIALCFYKCKFAGVGRFNRDYISRESTNAVNGIFAFLIIMGHFVTYYSDYGVLDQTYIEVRSFLGQMVVSTFFIYSGYGIYESVKKKGLHYISTFPKNRVLKLLLHLDIAVIIFLVLFLILGYEVTLDKFLLSLIGWEYIGNNNWFVFATLVFYLITFVSFSVFKKPKVLPLIMVTMLTVAYIVVIQQFKPTFWYNSAICFPIGMWYSFFKERIERVVMKNNFTYYFSFLVCVVLFIGTRFFWGGFAYLTTYLLSCVLFGFFMMLLTMKIRFGNRVLDWFGKHAFSVYMLQRIPMIVMHKIGFLARYPHISFLITVAVTIIFAELFDCLTAFIDSKLFASKSKKTV